MTNRERRMLERAVMEAVLRSLRPAMEQVVVTFREQLDEILGAISAVDELPRGRSQLGRPKRCSICRLEGTRNDPGLPHSHTQEDHRRWKADAQQLTATRRRPLRAA